MKAKRIAALLLSTAISLATLSPDAAAQMPADSIPQNLSTLSAPYDTYSNTQLLSLQQQFLNKQRKLKSAAWKCLWIGGTAAVVGTATLLITFIECYDTNNDGKPGYIIGSAIAGAGVASMIASVPLFIAAHRNGKHANDITVALSLTSISDPAPSFTPVGMHPAASPALSFSLTF